MTFDQFIEAMTVYSQLLNNQRLVDSMRGRPDMFIANAVHLDETGTQEALAVLGAQQERLVERLRALGLEVDLQSLDLPLRRWSVALRSRADGSAQRRPLRRVSWLQSARRAAWGSRGPDRA